MNISDLLSSSGESDNTADSVTEEAEVARPPPPVSQSRRRFLSAKASRSRGANIVAGFVPDSERKRPYRLSATRKRRRQEREEFESREFNLTLDINELRRQVQHLLECRDLCLTQLFVHRLRVESDVVCIVASLLNEFNTNGLSVTANALNCFFPRQHLAGLGTGRKVQDLVLGGGTHVFSHRSWATTSIKVVRFVEDAEDEEQGTADAAETRRLCGGTSGCVVEADGVFTGRITREMLAAFFPHALSNEALVAQIIGFSVTCPIQLVLYFDTNRRITHQVAHINILAAMGALHKSSPSIFAQLVGSKTAPAVVTGP
ncbi:uncharacterized protein IUM83_12834 [Phytophthora cinnamomi]|uniref:uncharacterized protein n=1 Tax=Phytophthora cinnamomi TaxID=4785 RepID=UPI00355A33AC|nr:hypothetical protein IUM83_12834 [Phytophthora cinnamomi]